MKNEQEKNWFVKAMEEAKKKAQETGAKILPFKKPEPKTVGKPPIGAALLLLIPFASFGQGFVDINNPKNYYDTNSNQGQYEDTRPRYQQPLMNISDEQQPAVRCGRNNMGHIICR